MAGSHEVRGSNPLVSTINIIPGQVTDLGFFVSCRRGSTREGSTARRAVEKGGRSPTQAGRERRERTGTPWSPPNFRLQVRQLTCGFLFLDEGVRIRKFQNPKEFEPESFKIGRTEAYFGARRNSKQAKNSGNNAPKSIRQPVYAPNRAKVAYFPSVGRDEHASCNARPALLSSGGSAQAPHMARTCHFGAIWGIFLPAGKQKSAKCPKRHFAARYATCKVRPLPLPLSFSALRPSSFALRATICALCRAPCDLHFPQRTPCKADAKLPGYPSGQRSTSTVTCIYYSHLRRNKRQSWTSSQTQTDRSPPRPKSVPSPPFVRFPPRGIVLSWPRCRRFCLGPTSFTSFCLPA